MYRKCRSEESLELSLSDPVTRRTTAKKHQRDVLGTLVAVRLVVSHYISSGHVDWANGWAMSRAGVTGPGNGVVSLESVRLSGPWAITLEKVLGM